MYYPYFRGKQYELLTIRECADLLKAASFIPIIEPVKEALSGLERALEAVSSAEGSAIVILNPSYGNHSDDGEAICNLFRDKFSVGENITPGILLSESISLVEIEEMLNRLEGRAVSLIHSGFGDASSLKVLVDKFPNIERHIFIEKHCGKLYQKKFKVGERVLLRDGFTKRSNREYPPLEFFSDLHATFPEEGVSGFGDYLTVGDDYSDGGGPAYAVAIHLTFINADEEMHIHHFVSKTNDTPKDPAKKFAEALDKLILAVNTPHSGIVNTSAIIEFKDLHTKGHFPGLGYVKKLSMKHHIETLMDYFK